MSTSIDRLQEMPPRYNESESGICPMSCGDTGTCEAGGTCGITK
jgi:hypothetical protein